MSITIDKDRALELLHAAVNERGEDYVYPKHDDRCYYVNEDHTPGCLVGAALVNAGVTIDQLIEFGDGGEIYGSSEMAGDLCYTLRDHEIAEIDAYARTLFSLAQSVQDRGDTWGDAVREADAHAAAYLN